MMKKIIFCIISYLLCIAITACTIAPDLPGDSSTEPDTQSSAVPGSDAGEAPGSPEQSNATEVDIFLFMGSDNMAGRGNAEECTPCTQGHAYEFKAVSDPEKLYPMTAEFGKDENNADGVDDGSEKTGSLVPAFCEAYYKKTQTPVIAVSCSEGGTTIAQWKPGNSKLEDAATRLDKVKKFVEASADYEIRHILMVWCQGEADALSNQNFQAESYVSDMGNIVSVLVRRGVEKCFLIQTGSNRGNAAGFESVRQAQETLCANNKNVVPVSRMFSNLNDMLQEDFLYTQPAYNLVGADAGANAAAYVLDPEHYFLPKVNQGSAPDDQFDGDSIELPICPFG